MASEIGNHYTSNDSIRRQFFKWSLAGLILVPTVFLWLVAGSHLFGYQLVSVSGTSMEPTLHHGDILWTKYLDPADVKVGDIVTLQQPALGWIAHRVVKIASTSQESYILETQGDANSYPEVWVLGVDEKVAISLVHIRFVGYALEFLDSTFSRVILVAIALAVVALWVRRTRIKPT